MQVLGQDYVNSTKEQIGYAFTLGMVGFLVIVGVTYWVRRREKGA